MAKFFVCEAGPMGGIHIVFVCDEKREALEWVAQNPERDLHIYMHVF